MKLTKLVVLFGLSLLLSTTSLSAKEKAAEIKLKHLEQGNKYYKHGEYGKAAIEYKTAWEKGEELDALYNLGHLYDFQLGNNELAIKYYNEYTAIDPSSPDVAQIVKLREKAQQDIAQENEWRQALDEKNSLTPSPQTKHQKITPPTDPPPPDKEGFNKGLSRACLSCHVGFMGPGVSVEATHPVGRVPKGKLAKTVPVHVRFYKEGEVICLSCHDPKNIHFKQGTPGKTYKALRVDTGSEGEDISRFCAMCHKDKSSPDILRGEEEKGGRIIRRD